jgi:hypothetical protein
VSNASRNAFDRLLNRCDDPEDASITRQRLFPSLVAGQRHMDTLLTKEQPAPAPHHAAAAADLAASARHSYAELLKRRGAASGDKHSHPLAEDALGGLERDYQRWEVAGHPAYLTATIVSMRVRQNATLISCRVEKIMMQGAKLSAGSMIGLVVSTALFRSLRVAVGGGIVVGKPVAATPAIVAASGVTMIPSLLWPGSCVSRWPLEDMADAAGGGSDGAFRYQSAMGTQAIGGDTTGADSSDGENLSKRQGVRNDADEPAPAQPFPQTDDGFFTFLPDDGAWDVDLELINRIVASRVQA